MLTNVGLTLDAVRAEVVKALAGPKAAAEGREVVARAQELASRAAAVSGAALHEGKMKPAYELHLEDEFAAAHRLRGYQGECERLHGHNWRVEAVLVGEKLNNLGMLIDFRDARAILKDIIDEYDHKDLNELAAFTEINPTTENLSRLICEALAARLPEGVAVQSVTTWESPRCGVTYRG